MSLFADSESSQVAIATVFSILVILDIIGNSLVCVIIASNHDMRYAEKTFLTFNVNFISLSNFYSCKEPLSVRDLALLYVFMLIIVIIIIITCSKTLRRLATFRNKKCGNNKNQPMKNDSLFT